MGEHTKICCYEMEEVYNTGIAVTMFMQEEVKRL